MNQLIIPNFSPKSKDFFHSLCFGKIPLVSLNSLLNFCLIGIKMRQKEEYNMRKRIVFIMLAALMLLQILSMTGCSQPEPANPGSSETHTAVLPVQPVRPLPPGLFQTTQPVLSPTTPQLRNPPSPHLRRPLCLPLPPFLPSLLRLPPPPRPLWIIRR